MHSSSRTSLAALALGLALAARFDATAHAQAAALEPAPEAAQFRGASGVAGQMAEWVTAAGDNDGLPFAIIDKLAAKVSVFSADGSLLGSAPVLVGLARGDDSAPGVGNLKLAEISPDQRTTPAGRFVAQFGPSEGHGQVLWVDFADSISMHPVMSVSPGEHRLRRIQSADPTEHRISFGCINVPAKFYGEVVQSAFAGGGGVVYILPDTKPLEQVFPAFAAAIGEDEDSGELAEHTPRWDPMADPPASIPDLAAAEVPLPDR